MTTDPASSGQSAQQDIAQTNPEAPDLPAADQTLVKVCPRCSVQSQTTGDFCPHCGGSFTVDAAGASMWRYAQSKAGRRIALGVVLILVLGGVTTGVVLKIRHDDRIEAQQVAAAEERRTQAAADKAKAEAAAAQRAADDAKRGERAALITALEDSIVKDAKEKVQSDLLDGPIIRASCDPLGGGSVDDLTELTGTFECIAVNKELADGSASGYRFSATINWNDYSYTWHLG